MEEQEGSVIRKPRSKKNYINGMDFHLSLVSYKTKLQELAEGAKKPTMPPYIGACIMRIAEKLSTKWNFMGYSYRDEMISDAIEKMVESVEKYDIVYKASPNPFGYFTQVAWNAYLQRIQREKKQAYIKHKNFENFYVDEFGEMTELLNNEEHNKVIEDFEAPKKPASENNYAVHKNLSYEKNRRSRNEEKVKKDEQPTPSPANSPGRGGKIKVVKKRQRKTKSTNAA